VHSEQHAADEPGRCRHFKTGNAALSRLQLLENFPSPGGGVDSGTARRIWKAPHEIPSGKVQKN